MAEPTHPVLYFRDFATRTELVAFDTLEKLIAAKPLQVIEFETDSADNSSVVSLSIGGVDNIVDEPLFSPAGVKTIEKQMVGAISEFFTINIMLNKSQYAKARKIQQFARRPGKEKEYHTYGIFGFWFPETETDPTPTLTTPNVFKQDPTNVIGYTMKPPLIDWGIKDPGSDYIKIMITLSLGGKNLT